MVSFLLDNIADLATLLVALVVVLWHQVSPFDLPTLASWILAVIALVAISGLWDRNRRMRRLEDLVVDTNEIVRSQLAEAPRAGSFFSRNIEPRELEDSFSAANHICICGLTLARTTRQFMDAFSRRLEAGADVRLAILDPSNTGLMEMMAARSMGTTTAEFWATRLKTVVQVVEATGARPPHGGQLSLGFAPFPPSFGLILIDPDQEHGKCFVEIYHHKTAERNATFRLTRADDPYWYSFFHNQWTEFWNACRQEVVGGATKPDS